MRRLPLVIVVILVLAVVGACTAPATPTTPATTTAPAATTAAPTTVTPIILKGDMSVQPETHATSRANLMAMKKIEERSNGRLKFDVSYGQTLVKLREAMATVGKGGLDWAWCGPSSYSGTDPRFNIAGMPMAWKDVADTFKAMHTTPLGKIVYDAMNKHGVEFVGWNGHMPYVHLAKNKAIRVLEDFKGQKIRAPGTAFMDAIKLLGGVPMDVYASEIYPAMEKGQLDAAWLGLYTIDSYKLIEQVKYITEGPFAIGNIQGIMINLEKFNSLPKDLQQLIHDCYQETEPEVIKFETEENAVYIEKAKKAGIEYIIPSKEETDRWIVQAGRPVWESVAKEIGGADGDLMLKTMLEWHGMK